MALTKIKTSNLETSIDLTGINDTATSQILTVSDTGIDVTGTVVADGLTVDGNTTINSNSAVLRIYETGGSDLRLSVTGSNTYVSSHLAKPLNFLTDNKLRQTINSGGDISFYDSTGTTAKFFWDASAERLGIGTSSPSATLDVNGHINLTDGYELKWGGAGATIYGSNSNNQLRLYTNNTERMRIDSSGNVGIGTSNPQGVLDLGNATNGRGIAWGGSTGTAHYTSIWAEYGNGSLVMASGLKGSTTNGDFIYPYTGTYGYAAIELDSHSDDGIKFYTVADAARTKDSVATKQERMRIDTSGNLLVSKTSDDNSTAGVVLRDTGEGSFVASGQRAALFNRLSTDGDIAEFRKDGTTVGSIGVSGGNNLYISGEAANHAGLTFATDAILPTRQGTETDDITNLGQSNGRFKDLYLSGGVYLGGTGSANKLDDYETGTWTAVPVCTHNCSNWSITGYTTFANDYIKIGNVVHFWFKIRIDSWTGSPSNMGISGLPFSTSKQNNSVGNARSNDTGNFYNLESISGTQIGVLRRYDNGNWAGGASAPVTFVGSGTYQI